MACDEVAHTCVIPQNEVRSEMDIGKWKISQAYSIVGMRTTDEVVSSETLNKLLKMLETIKNWTFDYPPEDMGSQRFGNKAYRKWYARLKNDVEGLFDELLPENKKQYTTELSVYLLDSFGNPTRIDYGTGHEACFLITLMGLFKLRLFSKEHFPAVALRVVAEYLRVCKHLQKVYHMEPAGSRGVHAIDDFQFVPFLWGSAQLVGSTFLPDHYTVKAKVASNIDLSLFIEAIDYINETKSGPFHEHSNQLWNISAVPNWEKEKRVVKKNSQVNCGLFKMYEAEVLAKFPVVQHFKFGSLFSIKKAPPRNIVS